ncbi:MAG: cyclic nucleotide-binding domain-containing protein [Arenicellales bacterium]|nr:cyclic nucleotide-binding domain-containing protein [Arenicellales bacterium]
MIKLLDNLYLFRGLPDSDLSRIAEIAELKSYARGEQVFRQGDSADSFFVIQYGTVNIELDDEDGKGERIEVATLGTGSHFGEMSFLDNEPRSANASVATDSDIIKISYASMRELLESDSKISIHVYRELAKFLCSRLRLTTLDLSYERSKNLGYL